MSSSTLECKFFKKWKFRISQNIYFAAQRGALVTGKGCVSKCDCCLDFARIYN